MKLQPAHKKILEYLEEYGSANTFKLSRVLKIERSELISLVEELTKEGLTKFRSGTVIKGDRPVVDQKTIDTEEKKPVSKPILTLKKPKKSRILRDKQFGLEKIEEKTRRLEVNWLKKEEELKKDIEDLQTQRDKTAQKLSKEKALLCQIREEKRELEKSLAVWESSLKQREESVQRNEEDIQKRKESVSVAEKRLEREKEKISKAKVLKKDTNKLESTLGDLKKTTNIKRKKPEKLRKKKIKPKKVIPKEIEKVEKKVQGRIEKQAEESRIKKEERLEAEEQRYSPIGSEEQKIEDSPTLGSDDFEEPEQIKPTLKSKIKGIIAKIRVSKTETEQPKVTPEELLQPTTEIDKEKIEDKFHDLIEQEISLLKQRRIREARSVHLQIKDMISEVTDTDQRKMIIMDWNRIKDVY